MNLGLSIKLALVYENRSAHDLSLSIGRSEAYISMIVNKKRNPSIVIVEQIAKELGYKTSELIALGE